MARQKRKIPYTVSLPFWFLLLLISITAVGGFFVGSEHHKKASKDTSLQVTETSLKPKSNFSEIQNKRTDGWLTYEDSVHKFSLDIPVGFAPIDEKDSNILYVAKGIRIYTDQYSHDPTDCKALCPTLISDQNLTINGIAMRKIVSESGSPTWPDYKHKTIEYIVKRDNLYYVIQYRQDPHTADETSTIEEIVKTFKFL